MAPVFELEEFVHYFTFRKDILHSYVVEVWRCCRLAWHHVAQSPTTHKITAFTSFYSLPSTIIGHPVRRHACVRG